MKSRIPIFLVCVLSYLFVVLPVTPVFPQELTDGSRLVIEAYPDTPSEKISRHIYGHFAEHLGRCIYGGFWVGEGSEIPNVRGIRTDVVEALKKVSPPVIRWPGGCFADEYHWKEGIGPKEERPPMLNTHWGRVVEDNSFGTHEFMDLCEQLGTEAYVAGNVGSGTVEEMQDWVEYMTYAGDTEMGLLRKANGREDPWKVPFMGIGNENWGCGGQMEPEFYAELFRRYSTYVREYSGNQLTEIAGGAGSDDYRWTEVLMRDVGRRMDAMSVHYYVVPNTWQKKGPATGFGEADWFSVMRKSLELDPVLQRHIAIMDRYDPENRVQLMVDEWGTWYDAEPGSTPGFLYQQNSLRDAVSAAIMLNIFNSHARRVKMANLAQTVNVLQAMILTEGDKMVLTPTYHVFEMYKVHQDADLLTTRLQTRPYHFEEGKVDRLHASASRKDGKLYISIANTDPRIAEPLEIELRGARASNIQGRILTADQLDTHNTFENPDQLKPQRFSSVERTDRGISLTVPGRSVVVLQGEIVDAP
ncbi:MAG: alpha-N-arabinofuranosidase [Acidobacteriota bacterium]|nr:MAG: alpha-N-arabinofuranosidase [Acidobacteriota bacterium]